MDYIDLLGLIAGFCTMSAVIPQIIKAWKTKHVKDISPIMFSVLVIGVGLWVIYGIIKNDFAIIVTNSISLALNLLMLVLLVTFKNKK